MHLFIKLFIIIISILLLLTYISLPFVNPYKCIGYIGKKGSGKSTEMTKIAITNIKKGKIVYCTEPICGTRLINPDDIGFYDFPEESVLLVDEIGSIYPARDYKGFKAEVRKWFKLQRHKKVKVYWFTQTWVDCDKTIRDLTDRIYLCHNFFHMWSTYRLVSKILTIGTSRNEDGSQSNQGSDFVELFKFEPLIFPHSLEITFIPRWVYFYNSFSNEPLPPINYKLIDIADTQKEYFSNRKAMNTFYKLLFIRIHDDIISIALRIKDKCINLYLSIVNKFKKLVHSSKNDLSVLDDKELYEDN